MRLERHIVEEVIQLAAARGVPVSSLTIDELAAGLGVSRMTLYRRIGPRKAQHEALRAQGHDPGETPGAAERAIAAATELIREVGIAAMTLEAVASRAQCAPPTIYAQFGGRAGLLMAVFERHSPVPRVREVLVRVEPGDAAGLRRCIGRVYRVVLDTLRQEQALLRAIASEGLRDPSGDVGQFLASRYVPSIGAHVVPWIEDHTARGVFRPLPPVLILQQLVAPIALHGATRPLVEAAGVFALPAIDDVADALADMFCRAVEQPVDSPAMEA